MSTIAVPSDTHQGSGAAVCNRPLSGTGRSASISRVNSHYDRRMAQRATLTSDGDTWTFEEGRRATFVDRKGKPQQGDFEVIQIVEGAQFLLIQTSLRGISRFDWTPLIQWAGEYQLDEV